MYIDPDQLEFGEKMLKILGLPKGTKWFELRFAVGEIVTVKGQFYPECGAQKFIDFLNQYEITKKEPT